MLAQVVAVSGPAKTVYVGGQNAVTATGEIVGGRPRRPDRGDLAEPRSRSRCRDNYDLDGPAGTEPSRCITIPDKATIEQIYRPQSFARGVLGTHVYDCQT